MKINYSQNNIKNYTQKSFKALPKFKPVEMSSWEGKQIYDFFMQSEKPHGGLCMPVDIKKLKTIQKKLGTTVNQLFMYAIGNATNSVDRFRFRFADDNLVKFDDFSMGLPIPSKQSRDSSFVFGYIPWEKNLKNFLKSSSDLIKEVRNRPVLFDNQKIPPNALYLSHINSFFTSVNHPFNGKSDIIPRITWGEPNPFAQIRKNSPVLIPLDIQGHHSVISGGHIEKFVKIVQETCNKME